MRKIEYIVIHCAATRPSQNISAATIRRWHKKRGWSDIGYHFFIKRNGTLEAGRDRDKDGYVLEEVGAHVKGYNSKSIAICYAGGIDNQGNAQDNRTEAQKTTMATLVNMLSEMYPGAQIKGHRDFPNVAKSCPSFDVGEWLKTI